jgi:hypothetical protein
MQYNGGRKFQGEGQGRGFRGGRGGRGRGFRGEYGRDDRRSNDYGGRRKFGDNQYGQQIFRTGILLVRYFDKHNEPYWVIASSMLYKTYLSMMETDPEPPTPVLFANDDGKVHKILASRINNEKEKEKEDLDASSDVLESESQTVYTYIDGESKEHSLIYVAFPSDFSCDDEAEYDP